MRHVDRHSDGIHSGDHLPAERGQTAVLLKLTSAAELVFAVISELRQPLAHPVELIHVVHAAEMIRVLHPEDDADLAILPGAREIV
jgi:hypothetical protein